MAKSKKRTYIGLECEICKQRNYTELKQATRKEKVEKTKYCAKCLKHTKHNEAKMK